MVAVDVKSNVLLDVDANVVVLGTIDTEEYDVSKQVNATVTVGEEVLANPALAWASEDATVVTVENGLITAVGAGTATITAKVANKSFKCKVTVKSVALNKKEATSKIVTSSNMEAPIGIEPMNQSFADSCLTAWLRRHFIIKMSGAGNGNRTRNLTLARSCFTTKLYLHQ